MKIVITEQVKDVKVVYEFVGNKEDVVSAVFDLGINQKVDHRWEDGDYGKVAEHAVLASSGEYNSINDIVNSTRWKTDDDDDCWDSCLM